MEILIDINTLSPVFNPGDSKHNDFQPVFDWIDCGRCKMVYGGTKYKRELEKMPNYLRLINIYKDKGIAIPINDNAVDLKEIEILGIVPLGTFNDHHLVAIVIVSRCLLVCTMDNAAIPFMKDRRLYPRGCPRPKFYTNRNILLLERIERRN